MRMVLSFVVAVCAVVNVYMFWSGIEDGMCWMAVLGACNFLVCVASLTFINSK